MKNLITLLLILTAGIGFSQVLINDQDSDQTPNSAAVLELRSADKGLLVQGLTAEPAAVEGMIFFDEVFQCMKGYDGTKWQQLGDCLPLPEVSFSVATAVFNENDQTGTVQLSYENQTYAPVQVNITASDNPLSLQLPEGLIEIPANASGTLDYTFTWTDNTLEDGEKIFTLNFTESESFEITTPETITVSILDDEINRRLENETFGSEVLSNPYPEISNYNGFSNPNLTYTGTADVRSNSVSNGYSGASGGNNILFNASTDTMHISGINETASNDPLTLTMGIWKSTATATGSGLIIEYSTDGGNNWTDITYSGLPDSSGTGTWFLVTVSDQIPNTITDLKFSKVGEPGNNHYRIDDINLD